MTGIWKIYKIDNLCRATPENATPQSIVVFSNIYILQNKTYREVSSRHQADKVKNVCIVISSAKALKTDLPKKFCWFSHFSWIITLKSQVYVTTDLKRETKDVLPSSEKWIFYRSKLRTSQFNQLTTTQQTFFIELQKAKKTLKCCYAEMVPSPDHVLALFFTFTFQAQFLVFD